MGSEDRFNGQVGHRAPKENHNRALESDLILDGIHTDLSGRRTELPQV